MTRDIDSATQTASSAATIHPVVFVKLELDTGDVLVHNDFGDISFGGDIYSGVGNLGQTGASEEVSDLSRSNITVTLSNIDGSMGSIVLNQHYQGRKATIYLGYLSLTTCQLVADPTIIYRGRLDTDDIQQDKTFTVTLSVESRFAAWDKPIVRRYNNADQQSRYPNDKGLTFIEQTVGKQIIWGGPG